MTTSGSNGSSPTTIQQQTSWSERIKLPFSKSMHRKSVTQDSNALIVDISSQSEDSTFEVTMVDGETVSVDLDRLRLNNKFGDVMIQVCPIIYATLAWEES